MFYLKNNVKHLIGKFEANKDQQVSTDLDNHRHFTEININQHQDWKNMVDGLYQSLRPYVEKYKQDCNITEKQWPDNLVLNRYDLNDIYLMIEMSLKNM
jgi:hypothetical protein